MNSVVVLYIPVLHEGYIRFFERHKGDTDTLYILDDTITAGLSPYRKEIRAVDAVTMKRAIEALGSFKKIEVLTSERIGALTGRHIITTNEEVVREFIKKYLPDTTPEFDTIFLRWDEEKVNSAVDVQYDRVSEDPLDREMAARAADEAEKSSDWWRHVGCVIVKDGKVILEAHNHHVPSEHMPYAQGDPRDFVKAGTLNLVYSSLHAEQTAVAEAARRGLSLEDASIYMNVFPCPLCAKLVAYSGIKKCFFKTGAAWLDAESVLKAKGVEIVLVK